MSKTGHKPSPRQSEQLADFLIKAVAERGISQRSAARHIGIDSAFLWRVMNNETTPNAYACNLIADYFDIPRVQVYAMAGWLDLADATDMKEVQALKPLFSDPDDQAAIEQIYANIGDRAARARFIQLLQRLKGEARGEYPGP